MVGKKSGKALLREEGLERTDNNMDLSTWPQVNMINQKNYYTEYLKRDDQILPLRLQQEERRNRMTTNAKDRDRALAQFKPGELPVPDIEMDLDEDVGLDEGTGLVGQDALGSKIIVIHPGSQNLRIGLASDALPKTVPMVIARRSPTNESEKDGGEPKPKRLKLDNDRPMEPEKMFGDEFAGQYATMCSELKTHMRSHKRRVLPNSKELIVNYNKRTPPETISEHNDPLRIDWTEIPSDSRKAPAYITGKDALRIPDSSDPKYRLFWPLRQGWYNERDYDQKRVLYDDLAIIIEEAIKTQLSISRKKDWMQYGCVFVVPDLYERRYVTQILRMLLRDFGFARVCFIQESLAATFGAGYTSACVVDIGAQKTSVCCVEEGMCLENSRINLKYGGADVTETFIKMMLFDHFPYSEINLNRRYDFLLAEEIKIKFCTLNEGDVSPQPADFHLRASGQPTRKYFFKTYDEILLAPQGYFRPSIFDHSWKLRDRRRIIGRSRDLYDGSPNDPISTAQSAIIAMTAPPPPVNHVATNGHGDGPDGMAVSTPVRQLPNPLQKFSEQERITQSAIGSPAPDDDDTPAPLGEGETNEVKNELDPSLRDDVLPIAPLDVAILTSIVHGARNDDRKTRDFLGGIMVIGGGSQVPGLYTYLEGRLKESRPGFAKDVMIGTPPRELDPQGVVWKGGSVFGKLRQTNDSWINRIEHDRLGARVLAYKLITSKLALQILFGTSTTMAPSTLSLSCACRAITATISLPNISQPLPLEFCHCANCRHSSGQLAISCFTCPRAPSSSNNGSPRLRITSKDQPTAYKTSEELIRYFCAKCGASLWMHIPENGDYEICSGALDEVEGMGMEEVVKFKQHIFVESTRDGGMSAWIEGVRWKGWGEKSEVFRLPERGSSEQPDGGGENNEKRRLQCYCHCRGVQFYITPPDDNDNQEASAAAAHEEASNNDKWYLRASNQKYLAGLCACNSCRLSTGFDIQAWAFIPKPHLHQPNGTEISFNMGMLKTYSHSPGTYRDFCGTCGATVFWRCEGRRGDVIDVSAGLLDAKEGVRAEEWLEWRTRVSFEECAVNKGLIAMVKEGLEKYGEEVK
ncbi:MAG: hypothetical protein Q9169_003901 [Polycauliona sp. 2 TL-2023]